MKTNLTGLARLIASCCCVSASVGCAAKLEANDDEAAAVPTFSSASLGEGVTSTLIDATNDKIWRYFDLDTGEGVTEDNAGWDLKLCRFKVLTNGGVTGDGGVEVAAFENAEFDAFEAAPREGFEGDREDSVGEQDNQQGDANTDPDNAFYSKDRNWYDYNLNNHTLSPHPWVYFVHTTDGAYFKLAFEGYYDKAGTPGWIKFKWAAVEPAAD
jgi:hypothetical protein